MNLRARKCNESTRSRGMRDTSVSSSSDKDENTIETIEKCINLQESPSRTKETNQESKEAALVGTPFEQDAKSSMNVDNYPTLDNSGTSNATGSKKIQDVPQEAPSNIPNRLRNKKERKWVAKNSHLPQNASDESKNSNPKENTKSSKEKKKDDSEWTTVMSKKSRAKKNKESKKSVSSNDIIKKSPWYIFDFTETVSADDFATYGSKINIKPVAIELLKNGGIRARFRSALQRNRFVDSLEKSKALPLKSKRSFRVMINGVPNSLKLPFKRIHRKARGIVLVYFEDEQKALDLCSKPLKIENMILFPSYKKINCSLCNSPSHNHLYCPNPIPQDKNQKKSNTPTNPKDSINVARNPNEPLPTTTCSPYKEALLSPRMKHAVVPKPLISDEEWDALIWMYICTKHHSPSQDMLEDIKHSYIQMKTGPKHDELRNLIKEKYDISIPSSPRKESTESIKPSYPKSASPKRQPKTPSKTTPPTPKTPAPTKSFACPTASSNRKASSPTSILPRRSVIPNEVIEKNLSCSCGKNISTNQGFSAHLKACVRNLGTKKGGIILCPCGSPNTMYPTFTLFLNHVRSCQEAIEQLLPNHG